MVLWKSLLAVVTYKPGNNSCSSATNYQHLLNINTVQADKPGQARTAHPTLHSPIVALTVEAEGDVDDPLLCKALQVRNPGALEVRRRGRVTHVDPAHRLLGIEEVHGGGLFGGGGQQAVDGGAAQGRGLDVLGVGDQQDRQAVHWH